MLVSILKMQGHYLKEYSCSTNGEKLVYYFLGIDQNCYPSPLSLSLYDVKCRWVC